MPRGPRTALFSLLTLIAGAVVALVLPAAAHGAPYPPKTCARIAVSTTTPQPGETIAVSGANFHAGDTEKVVLRPYGATLATVTVHADGTFSTRATMPRNAHGQQNIAVAGPRQNCPVAAIGLTVRATGPGAGLPSTGANGAGGGPAAGNGGGGLIPGFTGTDVLILLAIAAALITAGVAFTHGGRRRGSRVWTH